MGRRTLPRNAPQWRRVLLAVEKREGEAAYRSPTTLRYDIDVSTAATWQPHLTVHVRAVYGSGAHTSFHAASLFKPFINHVSSHDAALLSLLEGSSMRTTPVGPYGSLEPKFLVPVEIAARVLEDLALSGDAYLAKPGGEVDPEAPALRWDDGAHYDLALEVRMLEPGALEIEPYLRRGEEVVGFDVPVLVLDGDVLLFRDRVSHMNDGGQREWLEWGRANGQLPLAEADLGAFLEELHTRQSAPRVDLPEERAFVHVKVPPLPYVILKTQATRGISIDLGLTYAKGLHVYPHEPGHALVDREGRRILERAIDAETAAEARLLELGAQPVGGRYRIAKRDLVPTARAILALGWHVEIDGRVHRRATSLALGIASGVDWFDVTVKAEFGAARLPFPELLAAMRQERRSVVLSDGSIGEIPEEWVERFHRWSALAEPTTETLRFRRSQAGLVAALADGEASVAMDEAFEKARGELRAFDGIEPMDPSSTFRGTLRDYQRRALGWFAYLVRFGFGGCLADDMGLGKTVQVLAMLEARRGGERGPSLVVAPRSVLYNWASEAARFAPDLRVHVHDGGDRDASCAGFAQYDVVMTTYGLLRRDAEALARVPFDFVVLDEAQAIKTTRSAAAKAARALDARHKLALTGTPIENHLGELSSLLDFLNPGVLGASSALQRLDPGARTLDAETRDLLGRAIRPFFLRRTKQEVAKELPARVEQTIYCELEPEHRRLYDELHQHYRESVARRIEREGWGKSAVHVLEALLRLRQVACHPGLMHRHRRGQSSAKVDALLEHLASARAEGQKALVFSQFTTLLGIVRARLEEKNVPFEYLDGSTKDRARRVERFQTDPECSVFLLSLKAGGVGLNLPAAEYVFLLDPWWNPASEAQAIDRAHRIGQTKTVFAYRLLSRGTIEEKVEALQREKRALADAFFGDRGAALGGLAREDLEALLA